MFCTLVNILVSKELKKEAGYVEASKVKQPHPVVLSSSKGGVAG